jgi:hypothetical protein
MLKIIIFWDVVPYSVAEIDRRFRGVYCLNHDDKHLLKRRCISTRLHVETSHNTAIFILPTVRTLNLTTISSYCKAFRPITYSYLIRFINSAANGTGLQLHHGYKNHM